MQLSRDPNLLHPDVKRMHEEFLRECKDRGIHIITTCTWRSPEQQAELYAQGRTKPGRIVTRAKPGQTAHNYIDDEGKAASLAFDIVPQVKGQLVWGTKGVDGALWEYIGAIGKEVGLQWGGYWKFKDRPHFQHRNAKVMLKERFPESWK